MRRFLMIAVPLLLAILIVLSISWYFFQYDTAWTRNTLLQYARRMEDEGNRNLAVWLYNLAYECSGDDDAVAMELAQQFKAIGNYTKAEYTLSKAIEDGGSVELYVALCQTYLEQDKLRDAVLMLDKVSDPSIKAQLDALRPAAPAASEESGTYMQYLSVHLSADGKIYCNTREDYPSTRTDAYTAPLELGGGQTTLFAVSVGENGLVSPLAVYHYMIGSVVEEVVFTDAAIEQMVRQVLGVDDHFIIHSNQLWELETFRVPAEAESCSDLKWMPYLEELTIEGACFEDLQILSSLTRLHTLRIIGSNVSRDDLERIAALPLLENLALQDCGISNISPLAQCENLIHLDLQENAIRDLHPLTALHKLESLNLRSNAVISAESIAGMTQLKELDLAYNSLTTTAPLSALTGLTALDVSSNGLMKLEGLEPLINLHHFAAAGNNLISIDSLSGCTQLETLNVSNNTLLNIDVVATMKHLVNLDFSHNEVSRLPKFDTACALETIDGSYNALSSVERLSKLENLQSVYMNYNKDITTADSLQYCPALQQVHVYGTKVRNVSKLTDKGIFVQYTPV